MHEVKLIEKTGRHRHGPVDAAAALFQRLDGEGLAGQIDALGRERQSLADPAAAVMQHGAEGAHRTRRFRGGTHEGPPLVGGQIEAFALGIVQLHLEQIASHLFHHPAVLPGCPPEKCGFRGGLGRLG